MPPGTLGGFLADGTAKLVTLWGMWVDPAVRRQGVAQKLVGAVAGWAGEVGADRLQLAVTDCDASRPAAALYRRLGFVDSGEREPLDWNPSLLTRIMSRSLQRTRHPAESS